VRLCTLPHPLLQALITSGPGCYRTFLGALCDNTKYNSSLTQPLFSLTQRCLGLNATCIALDQPGSLLPAELEARTVNSTNTKADKATKATVAGAAAAAADSFKAGSSGSAESTKTEHDIPVMPEPDSYRLLPKGGDARDPEVFLATPEEIDMVVHGADGSHGRRMLHRQALRWIKH
jgi:hypothetical protein